MERCNPGSSPDLIREPSSSRRLLQNCSPGTPGTDPRAWYTLLHEATCRQRWESQVTGTIPAGLCTIGKRVIRKLHQCPSTLTLGPNASAPPAWRVAPLVCILERIPTSQSKADIPLVGLHARLAETGAENDPVNWNCPGRPGELGSCRSH
jgi:hypothetical protein